METTFSILIPHKNRPQLLERAIHSVPKRDDVQIIVVDDNSDPEIVDFECFPCIGEENVEIYLTKEGKGAGYARNVGLPHVKGKWLLCLDSDDYFTDEMPALMDKVADRDEDVIFFESTAIKEPSMMPSTRGESNNEQVENALATGDYSELFLLSHDAMKFYSADFIREHSISFHEVRWGNDVWFTACVAKYARTYTAFTSKAYCITESDYSLVATKSLESSLCRLEEESMAAALLRHKFKNRSLQLWLVERWKEVWKLSMKDGLRTFPKTLIHGGSRMIPYFLCFFEHLLKAKIRG